MAFPVNPKREFFNKPADLKPGYGTVVTEEGHIYGYLTPWQARLIGSGSKNTKPPRSKSGLAYANAFNTKCDDGTVIRTGVLAGKGGHHYKGNFKLSQEAYADIEHKVARVVYGEDKDGVWFSGALCSHVDEEMVEHIRSSGVSGHWERPAPGKGLELLGAVCVNIPGFAQASNHDCIAASATLTPTGGVVLTPTIEEDTSERGGSDNSELPKEVLGHVLAAGNHITAAAGALVPVSGVLAALKTPTVDGRQVDNVQWDRLPMPLWYLNEQSGWGHLNAKIVGRIDDIRVEGNLVMFEGVIDEGLPGSEGAQAVADLNVLGISMDGCPDPESEVSYELDEYGWPEKVTFEMYNIHGGTLTPMPAFHETLGVTTDGSDNNEEEEDTEESTEVEGGDDTANDEGSDYAGSAKSEFTTIKPPIVWH